MLYSVKMRSSAGAPHERGGRHISGAERIVEGGELEETAAAMLRRARTHPRGGADFINLKIEAVNIERVLYKPLLPVTELSAAGKEEGRRIALEELVRAGVTPRAAKAGMEKIAALAESIRGAFLLDSGSGERLDDPEGSGVRVSGMDCDEAGEYLRSLEARGLRGEHIREALVLASKAAGHDGVAAELCWSDDPGYVTGYVASRTFGYRRIPVMKDLGDPVGGRVFFVNPGADIAALIEYLRRQTVLLRLGR